jgi:hypothetical protein
MAVLDELVDVLEELPDELSVAMDCGAGSMDFKTAG